MTVHESVVSALESPIRRAAVFPFVGLNGASQFVARGPPRRPPPRAMAPASAAVEIDPRLLRQLEDEYESLKNDSSGARGVETGGLGPSRRPATLRAVSPRS
jgi:hypothetical protein